MAQERVCEFISCDRCDFLGRSEEWLDESSPNLREFLLEKKGIDIATPEGRSYFHLFFAGAVCPECGNHAEIDTDPFNTINGYKVPPEYLRQPK